jgi:cephalosporin hydroxylase
LPRPLRKGWGISLKINRTVSNVLELTDIEKIDKIKGHLHPTEGMTLFYFAYRPACNGRIVEIGSFKGKSTAWLATALKVGKVCDKVITIDPHINVKNPEVVPPYDEPTSYEAMLQNLRDLGLLPFVDPIVATSQCAAKNYNQSIRLLFIDGSHRYEDVLLDLHLWEPWVNVGGVICMHDTHPEVKSVNLAISNYVKPRRNIKKLLELGNFTVFKKLSSH